MTAAKTDGKITPMRRRKGQPTSRLAEMQHLELSPEAGEELERIADDPTVPAHRGRAVDEVAAISQPTEPEMMVLQLVLVFHVDGKAVAHTPFVAQVPRPAEDQTAQLELKLDGRVLMEWLEPHLGPSQASASATKPKLWTPGQ